VAQTVKVSGKAAMLNTTDASLGNVVSEQVIGELPLFARSATQMLTFQPGVTVTTTTPPTVLFQGILTNGTDDRNGAVNGGKSDQSNIVLDGMDVNDQIGRVAFSTVLRSTLDSVEEFRTTTLNAPAEQGRSSGAQVALVTKSGTNSYHGSLYEYNRNTATAAADFFSNQANLKKPALNINIFGASAGGPIKKDKLFLFANFERRVDASDISQERSVPYDSYKESLVNYANTSGGISTLDPAQVIAQDPLHIGPNQAIVAIMNTLPSPNDLAAGDGLNFGGYRFSSPHHATQDTYIARLDYNLGAKNTLSWRGTLNYDHNGGAPLYPGQTPVGTYLNNS
jgi:hypothetical protein